MKLVPHKCGLVAAGLLGGWHLLWSVVVMLGWGQAIIDFIFSIHMIHVGITVGPFDMGSAAILVVLTAAIGYCVGYAIALAWNAVHKN